MVNKIITYETSQASPPARALFVADNNELTFQQVSEQFVAYLPAGYEAQRVYLTTYTNWDKATQDIIASIDNGVVLINYIGHGDVTGWAGERVIERTDVALLNNTGQLPFVITLDCLNGYFGQPFYYSLGEEFVAAADRGAIGSFSPSGLGYTWEHEILGNQIFNGIFKESQRRLGAITTQAKIKAFGQGASVDVMRMFTLFGDPATGLRVAN
jgi:hypothetical protein